MTVKQELQIESEKTPKKDLEKIKVGKFLKSLEGTYKKIQEKFGPPLKKKERIDAEFFGCLYRCPRKEGKANFDTYVLELQDGKASLSVPRKITLIQEKQSLKIISVSFRWDDEIKDHDLFLEITAENGKLSSLRRRTRPNVIIKVNDPDSNAYNQLMSVAIDYKKTQLTMTLGYFISTGESVSFNYPGNNGPRSPKKTFKGRVAPQPPFENIVNRFQKIEEELLS